MSVKIYNGYAYPSNDIGQAIADFSSMRSVIADIGNSILARTCARLTVNKIDATALRGVECTSPLTEARCEILERQIDVRTTQKRDVSVDLETSVVLIPTEGRVLVMIWTEHDEITDALSRDLLPFQWWDNTDRPDGASENEWTERGDIWLEALSADPYHRPGNCGVTISFLPHLDGPSDELIMKNIPSMNSRVRSSLLPEICESLVKKGEDVMKAAMLCGQDVVLSQPYWVGRAKEIEKLLPEISHDMLRYGYKGKNDS